MKSPVVIIISAILLFAISIEPFESCSKKNFEPEQKQLKIEVNLLAGAFDNIVGGDFVGHTIGLVRCHYGTAKRC